MTRLDGRIALFTGATRGVGEAIPRRLAASVRHAVERFGGLRVVVNNAIPTASMASMASIMGTAGRPAYSTAKGGMSALTRYVAAEYGKQGVRCNTIIPGILADEGRFVTRAQYVIGGGFSIRISSIKEMAEASFGASS